MKLRLSRLDKHKEYEKYKDWGWRGVPNGREYYFKREYRFTIEEDFDEFWKNLYKPPREPKIEENIHYRIEQSNKQYKLESTLNKILDNE